MADDCLPLRELQDLIARMSSEIIRKHTADPRNRPAVERAVHAGARLAVHCVAPRRGSDEWRVDVQLIDPEGNVTYLLPVTEADAGDTH